MTIPITKHGFWPLVVIAILLGGAAVLTARLAPGAKPWAFVAAGVLMAASLAFFRDPERPVPQDKNVLIAPADGKVTDITEIQNAEFIGGPATRIGIFLSVFDVHVNRTPCAGTVRYVQRHEGACHNALNTELASAKNEAVSLGLDCPGHPVGKVLVKQITGAIARRIVCPCQPGQTLSAGERYGMIRFGSRTELYFPAAKKADILVKPGDTVRGGMTLLARFSDSEQKSR